MEPLRRRLSTLFRARRPIDDAACSGLRTGQGTGPGGGHASTVQPQKVLPPSAGIRFIESASEPSGLEAKILETFVELGQLSAAVDQAMDAGPRRVSLWVYVKFQGVALLAPGRTGVEG